MQNPAGLPRVPTPDPTAEIQLLRDQVDLLQVRAAEKRAPWWRHPSNLLSASALLLSVLSIVLTQGNESAARLQRRSEQRQEEVKRKLATLRENMIQVVQIRQDFNRILQSAATLEEKGTADMLFTMKRQLLMDEAGALIREIDAHVPSNWFVFMGYEMQTESNFTAAEKFFQRALRGPRSGTQPFAYRGLAGLYMHPNAPLRDLTRGRAHWRQAIAAQRGRDDFSRLSRGSSYITWATAELMNDEKRRATERFADARREFEGMSVYNPQRGYALGYLETVRNNLPGAGQPGDDLTRAAGEWKVRYPDRPALEGRAILVPNGAGQGLTLQAELVEGGVVVEKRTGSAVATGPRRLRIDWQGARPPSPLAPPAMLLGSMSLERSADGRLYLGEERSLGGRSVPIRLSRP
ncbi:MAG: hypothetical protein ACRDHY_06025 [Anaerolineales bacterium]